MRLIGYFCYMPLKRNFTYWIDKRKWKYIFLLATLELSLIVE